MVLRTHSAPPIYSHHRININLSMDLLLDGNSSFNSSFKVDDYYQPKRSNPGKTISSAPELAANQEPEKRRKPRRQSGEAVKNATDVQDLVAKEVPVFIGEEPTQQIHRVSSEHAESIKRRKPRRQSGAAVKHITNKDQLMQQNNTNVPVFIGEEPTTGIQRASDAPRQKRRKPRLQSGAAVQEIHTKDELMQAKDIVAGVFVESEPTDHAHKTTRSAQQKRRKPRLQSGVAVQNIRTKQDLGNSNRYIREENYCAIRRTIAQRNLNQMGRYPSSLV